MSGYESYEDTETDEDRLSSAISQQKLTTIKKILDRSPEIINTHSLEDYSYLLEAIVTRSSVKIIQFLIDRGANVNSGGQIMPGTKPLQAAISNSNDAWAEKVVKLLIDHGANIDGIPVLQRFSANLPMTIYLLNRGANPNMVDSEGLTPLAYVVLHNSPLVVVEALLDGGAVTLPWRQSHSCR
jgi:ankyrin repeat protein